MSRLVKFNQIMGIV